jgi:hypothetical protein
VPRDDYVEFREVLFLNDQKIHLKTRLRPFVGMDSHLSQLSKFRKKR